MYQKLFSKLSIPFLLFFTLAGDQIDNYIYYDKSCPNLSLIVRNVVQKGFA
jgi:hypothetical protein